LDWAVVYVPNFSSSDLVEAYRHWRTQACKNGGAKLKKKIFEGTKLKKLKNYGLKLIFFFLILLFFFGKILGLGGARGPPGPYAGPPLPIG
jgi:hypothetical protein